MGFYKDRIYPQLVTRLGDPPPIRSLRHRLLSAARGDVLEIGVGPGVNFRHYDPTRVTKLWALEPNAGMIRLAERRRRETALNVEFIGLPGERIPLHDACVDTVVSTFTLCTIPGILEAIRGIVRVLKPDGRFIFFEISRSPDAPVQRWQRWWEPFHRAAFAGLHLTRDLPALLEQGGLQVEQVECGYVARFPKSWAHCCWGSARRRSA
jgi:SAM-dependent methyltransferase